MGKILRSLLTTAAVLSAGMMFCTGCGEGEKNAKAAAPAEAAASEAAAQVNLAAYAPKGTDIIIYVNAEKMTQNPIYQKLVAGNAGKEAIASADAALSAYSLKLNDLLQSRFCIFGSADGLLKQEMAFTAIAGFRQDMAETIVATLAKKAEEEKDKNDIVSAADIDGHKALSFSGREGAGCLIAMNAKMLQAKLVAGSGHSVSKSLLTAKETAFTKTVNEDALFCISCDTAALQIPEAYVNLLKEEGLDALIKDLSAVALEWFSADGTEKIQLSISYKNAEAATASFGLINTFYNMGKAQFAQADETGKVSAENQKYVDALNSTKIE